MDRDLLAQMILEANKKAAGLVLRIVHRPEDVEDILQNAAINALKHYEQFNHTSSFSTWYTRIAVNCALMYLRGHKRKVTVSLDAIVLEQHTPISFISREKPADRLVLENEVNQILFSNILELSPVLKSVALKVLEGSDVRMDSKDKARKFRMKHVLKRKLEQQGVTRASL